MSERPEPLDRHKATAVVALALTIIASVVSIGLDIHRLSVINNILSDEATFNVLRFQSDVAAANTSDHQTQVIAIVEGVAFLLSAVFFLAWFYRAYNNVLRLGATTMRYTKGWAIGGWFVPIMNLWRPKQLANDLWSASAPDSVGGQPSSKNRSGLLFWWWTAWIVWGLASRASEEDWSHAKTLHAMRSAAGFDFATECLSVIAAGLAIAVVYKLTVRVTARAGMSSLGDTGTGGVELSF